jgi:hypothetical protein
MSLNTNEEDEEDDDSEIYDHFIRQLLLISSESIRMEIAQWMHDYTFYLIEHSQDYLTIFQSVFEDEAKRIQQHIDFMKFQGLMLSFLLSELPFASPHIISSHHEKYDGWSELQNPKKKERIFDLRNAAILSMEYENNPFAFLLMSHAIQYTLWQQSYSMIHSQSSSTIYHSKSTHDVTQKRRSIAIYCHEYNQGWWPGKK